MNKADLVNALKNENGFTRQQAEKIVDIFFNTSEPVRVKPKKLPFFRCGKELKERVDLA
ncbi:MAG: HU family DNA-binding protein [Desulfobacteraceae bacterium]